MCEPARVETESMNFSKDSMFYKTLYINKVNIVYLKSDYMYRMKIACTGQVLFGVALVLIPVKNI